MTRDTSLTAKQLRRFAWILASLFAFFGCVLLPWRWQTSTVTASAVIAAVLVVWSLVAPMSLAPVYRGWERLGNVLGWINSRIILGILFFLIVTPTALIMKIIGKDPMHRSRDAAAATYRIVRLKPPKDTDLERPY
ncbi:SxtJ family membrane protein [Hoeflea sp. CAU 1731]